MRRSLPKVLAHSFPSFLVAELAGRVGIQSENDRSQPPAVADRAVAFGVSTIRPDFGRSYQSQSVVAFAISPLVQAARGIPHQPATQVTGPGGGT